MFGRDEMLTEIIEGNKRRYFDAIGGEDSNYVEKLSWLKNRWFTETDSRERRLINPLIYQYSTPLHQAIVADNISFFTKNHNKAELRNYLDIACLCGSKNIADFLLTQLKVEYSTPGYELLLGYIASSMNGGWAIEAADHMAKKGTVMPKNVYGLASNDHVIDEILKIFAKYNPEYYGSHQSFSTCPVPPFVPYRETSQAHSHVPSSPQEIALVVFMGEAQMGFHDFVRQASPTQLEKLEKYFSEIQQAKSKPQASFPFSGGQQSVF